jgi:hypothetical protein
MKLFVLGLVAIAAAAGVAVYAVRSNQEVVYVQTAPGGGVWAAAAPANDNMTQAVQAKTHEDILMSEIKGQ